MTWMCKIQKTNVAICTEMLYVEIMYILYM